MRFKKKLVEVSDLILGPCVRRIPSQEKLLYLTFDDGPDLKGTPDVLQVLDKHSVQATFFVIVNHCKNRTELLREVCRNGHSVGNHSLDHQYKVFFSGKKSILSWIQKAEDALSDLINEPSVGFRSPVGIRTPELNWALNQLNIPLVLWNVRFYDTWMTWTEVKARHSISTTKPGSIVLLHDRQKQTNKDTFLKTLDVYIELAKESGFKFARLNRKMCLQALSKE
jgi:peptidoglycan/xylan/chitin deacetylase (PgdA/CDA1 family)